MVMAHCQVKKKKIVISMERNDKKKLKNSIPSYSYAKQTS